MAARLAARLAKIAHQLIDLAAIVFDKVQHPPQPGDLLLLTPLEALNQIEGHLFGVHFNRKPLVGGADISGPHFDEALLLHHLDRSNHPPPLHSQSFRRIIRIEAVPNAATLRELEKAPNKVTVGAWKRPC